MSPRCKQPGCPLFETGKCLEGFDPVLECPNYLAEGSQHQPAILAIEAPPEGVSLHAGDALDPAAAYCVARAGVARVVAVAGEQRSGKTTLIASLYEKFQEGCVGTYAFAGSQTLPGFERRCHESRMTSGRDKSDTTRTTPIEGFRFLHLRLFDRAVRASRNLLVGDMSGELYDAIRDSSDECRKYEFLQRADHFVVMLNGTKIIQGHHAETYAQARGLVRSLLDAGVLRSQTHVTLLTSKWDLLLGAGGEKARKHVSEVQEHFRSTFSARLQHIHFAHVAARPLSGTVEFAHGVEQLLAHWMEAHGLRPPPALTHLPSRREFDRFLVAQKLLSPWREV